MTGTLDDGNVCGVKVLGHAMPGALMVQQNYKFPLFTSLSGRGNVRQQNNILYEVFSSHVYIVITMDQPYFANFVKFSDEAKTTLTFMDVWNIPKDRYYRYAYDDDIIVLVIKDIDFVLGHLEAFGKISSAFDTKNIVLMGHSIGANIAQIKGFSDKRIKAIIDIDSKITEGAIFGPIGVHPNPDDKPVLFIRGTLQYQENVGDQ